MPRSDQAADVDAGDVAVTLDGVSRSFEKRSVLRGISLRVARGEFISMLGASGAGKTTLLRILAGLDSADHGTVDVTPARTVVFQEPRLILAKRVWENVVIGRESLSKARPAAIAALDEVGLAGHANAWPKTLSGGESQRVALARALATDPKLLLLDEPFAALDALTRIRMYALVERLWQVHEPAVVLVTHDIDEAILLSDRIVVLADGAIRFETRVDLPKPRNRAAEAFTALRSRLLVELGVTLPDESRQAA